MLVYKHSHRYTHARTHACTHARTHARQCRLTYFYYIMILFNNFCFKFCLQKYNSEYILILKDANNPIKKT